MRNELLDMVAIFIRGVVLLAIGAIMLISVVALGFALFAILTSDPIPGVAKIGALILGALGLVWVIQWAFDR
jgi:hypothetical protein